MAIERSTGKNPVERIDELMANKRLFNVPMFHPQEARSLMEGDRVVFQIVRAPELENRIIHRKISSGGLVLSEFLTIGPKGLLSQITGYLTPGLTVDEELQLSQTQLGVSVIERTADEIEAVSASAAQRFRDSVWEVIADLERNMGISPTKEFSFFEDTPFKQYPHRID
jgi:hypothetical protein